jgi:hypothetical protein
MEHNKYVTYVKVIGVVFFLVGGAVCSLRGWKEFKNWAIERKATKMATRAMNGYCQGEAPCQEWLGLTISSCAAQVTQNREDRSSPNLSPNDTRGLQACLQKSSMIRACHAGDAKCVARLESRYDTCFEYVYPAGRKTLADPGLALTGCLYGVAFESADSTGASGSSVVMLNKKVVPLPGAEPVTPNDLAAITDELTAEIKKTGEERNRVFDEAMSTLRESHATNEE